MSLYLYYSQFIMVVHKAPTELSKTSLAAPGGKTTLCPRCEKYTFSEFADIQLAHAPLFLADLSSMYNS